MCHLIHLHFITIMDGDVYIILIFINVNVIYDQQYVL